MQVGRPATDHRPDRHNYDVQDGQREGSRCVPWISTQGRVVQGVESVVVGQRYVGVVIQQQSQHVIALLGDGVVQRGVSLRILERSQ